MAKKSKGSNGQAATERKAYWQQPWAKRVMNGKYSLFDKLLFMRIASFGVEGCWMYNKTLAEEIGCCERYVREGMAKLWDGGELWITGCDSRNRKIYARQNPEVAAMAEARYKAELKGGKVTDLRDFYVKNKSRGYTTRNDSTGLEANNPEQEYRDKQPTRNHNTG